MKESEQEVTTSKATITPNKAKAKTKSKGKGKGKALSEHEVEVLAAIQNAKNLFGSCPSLKLTLQRVIMVNWCSTLFQILIVSDKVELV